MSNKPAWANEEDTRAESLAKSGETNNVEAPVLRRVEREPQRMQKAFYIQPKYAEAFENFVFKQKKVKGKRAPQLAEEAIKMLLASYGEDTSSL